MATYLFAWSPDGWPYTELKAMIDQFNAGQKRHRWSCGRTTKIEPGDRFYLIKRGLGCGARDLFGAGSILSKRYEEAHYSPKVSKQELTYYVDVEFDDLRDPASGSIVDRDDLLNDPALAWSAWDVTGGGKRIPDEVVVELDQRWPALVGREAINYPEMFLLLKHLASRVLLRVWK